MYTILITTTPITSIAPSPQNNNDPNIQNIFSSPSLNIPLTATPPYHTSKIHEIKEYLEIIPNFSGEVENLTQFIIQTEKIKKTFL